MSSRAGMFRRVMVRGRITAQRDAARLTSAQVNPLSTDLHAVFTFLTLRMLNGRDRFDMRTDFISHDRIITPASDCGGLRDELRVSVQSFERSCQATVDTRR